MKKILSIFLAILAGVCADAETIKSDGYSFYLKATRNGSMYKKGETAEFLLKVERDGKPVDGLKVSGTITKDTLSIGHKFSGETKNGELRVSQKLSEEGFLRCDATVFLQKPTGGNAQIKLVATAGFDVLKIPPSAPAPDDFDKFWDSQKKLLASTPINLKMLDLSEGLNGVLLYDIEADIPEAGKVRGYLALPKNANPKTLPAIVLPHQGGVRSSYKPIYWARNGFIALDFNAHGLPNGKPKEFYEKLNRGELSNYRTRDAGDRQSIFFRTLYLRLMRAMDVVMAREEWDGKNLLVNGESQAGGQAIVAAALYPDKVSAICAMYPALCDHTGFVRNRVSGWPHFAKINFRKSKPTLKGVDGARYIDALNFAPRVKCPVVFMINLADTSCPPTASFAVYNAIKSKKDLVVNEEARHRHTATSAKKTRELLLKNLKK